MRPCYADPTGNRAVADLVELDPSTWLLTRVNVPREHRGRGVARKLLQRVLADADAEGVTLVLHVMPYGSGGLQHRELAEWYARHGFRVPKRGEPASKSALVRRPQVQATMTGSTSSD